MHVVVIGAGIVGLTIATNLAERGASVTVLEQDAPGTGTTSTSYAWVNANNKQPESYYRLNLAGLQAHRRLAEAHHGDWIVPRGHLEYATDEAHATELSARAQRLTALGYSLEEVGDARAQQLVPGLVVPDDLRLAVYFSQEGHCFPQLYLAFQLQRARNLGVRVRTGAKVTGLDGGERPTLTLGDGSTLRPDRVVVAVGRWTGPLLASAGVPLAMAQYTEPGDVTVGYLCITEPVPTALPCLVTSPRLNVRPEGGGRLLLQALDLDATADPAHVPAADSDLGKEFLSRLTGVLHDTAHARVERIMVGQRAMPADGQTVVGPVPDRPGVYVVATHSGVTLAPVLGEGVAKEIAGEPEPLFADFRPDRLIGATSVAAPATPRKPGEQ